MLSNARRWLVLSCHECTMLIRTKINLWIEVPLLFCPEIESHTQLIFRSGECFKAQSFFTIILCYCWRQYIRVQLAAVLSKVPGIDVGITSFSEMFAAVPKEAIEGSFFQGIKRFESNKIRSMLLSPSSYSTTTPVFVVGVSGILGVRYHYCTKLLRNPWFFSNISRLPNCVQYFELWLFSGTTCISSIFHAHTCRILTLWYRCRS